MIMEIKTLLERLLEQIDDTVDNSYPQPQRQQLTVRTASDGLVPLVLMIVKVTLSKSEQNLFINCPATMRRLGKRTETIVYWLDMMEWFASTLTLSAFLLKAF